MCSSDLDGWIFRDVSITFEEGQLYGVIGDSGAGKTTFLKAIAGLLDVVEGGVYLDDKKLIGPSDKLIPGYEDIQLVNQDFALEPFHTVQENIKEKVLHLPYAQRDVWVEKLLILLELTHLANRQARYLSGGEQQRLSIARALACEPRFLLLDEPFVHLDQRLRLKIMQHLAELNQTKGTAIVLVSHYASEMIGFVNQIIHLGDGGIQRVCSSKDMYFHPQTTEQGMLMGIINIIEMEGQRVLFRCCRSI